MAIFERISDILKANINDLIDKAEDPEKMVKQLILEMEDQVDSATQALGQAMGSQKVAANKLADAKRQSGEWEKKAKLALEANDESLARRALDVKVGVDEQVAAMQASYDAMTKQVDELKDQVENLRTKLEEARSRRDLLIARSKMADAATEVATTISTATTTSAFSKLDKLEERVAQKEATAQAYTELNGDVIDTAEDFAELEHAAAVDTEMARLKKELGILS